MLSPILRPSVVSLGFARPRLSSAPPPWGGPRTLPGVTGCALCVLPAASRRFLLLPVPPGSSSGHGTGNHQPVSLRALQSLAMDRDLLRQSLNCHGSSLLSLLRSEQQDNPHFRSLLGSAAEPTRGPPPQQPLQGR